MTKSKQYESKIRMIANEILNSSTPTATCDHYIMDELTARSEKTFINKLLKKYAATIEDKKYFGMDSKQDEKVVEIMTSRMAVL